MIFSKRHNYGTTSECKCYYLQQTRPSVTQDQRKLLHKSFPRTLQSLMPFFSQTSKEKKKHTIKSGRRAKVTAERRWKLHSSPSLHPCDSPHYSVSCKSRVFAFVVEQELSWAQPLDCESCGYLCLPPAHKHPNWREGKTARGQKGGALLVPDELKLLELLGFPSTRRVREAPIASELLYVMQLLQKPVGKFG